MPKFRAKAELPPSVNLPFKLAEKKSTVNEQITAKTNKQRSRTNRKKESSNKWECLARASKADCVLVLLNAVALGLNVFL